jgi:hypothetical protein
METSISKSVLGVVVALLFVTGMALARGSHRADTRGKSSGLDIEWAATIPNGPSLQPGHYKVTLVTQSGASELDFYQNRKLVGQASVTLVPQPKKISQTEVVYDNSNKEDPVITEIDLGGWRDKVEFSKSTAVATMGH